MANQKISTYLTEVLALIPEDRFDVSKEISPGVFDTQYMKYSTLLTELNGDLTVNTLYNADDTVGAGRVVTLTDTLSFAGGQVNFAASALGYASLNLGNGVNPSVPVDGDLWYNGTELFFRDGVTNVDLLSPPGDGNGIYDGSGSVPSATIATLADTFQLKSTSAIMLQLYKNTNSGNNVIQFKGNNSAAAEYSYAQLAGRIETNTAASEEGSFLMQLSKAGSVNSNGAFKFKIDGLLEFPESINGGIFRDASANTSGMRWTMNLRNSTNVIENYAALGVEIVDNTTGSEDGILKLYARTAGVNFSGSNYNVGIDGAGLDLKTGVYHAGGTPGVSFGPAAVASITVKNGIVTAIS